MNKFVVSILLALMIALVPTVALAGPGDGGPPDDRGFDEFGYNAQANTFVGDADGIDRVNDDEVWGDETYADDHLVMKWNQAWDDRGTYEGAWENNNWNGKGPDGSGEIYHYKIVHNEDCSGANCVWGDFEIIQAQGVIDGEHTMEILETPNGYGATAQ
jgi:hypothetical protein